jgi:hypothetical protein
VSIVRAPQEGNICKREVQPHTREQPGLEPTVKIDICESVAFYQLCHKSNLRFVDKQLDPVFLIQLFVRKTLIDFIQLFVHKA